MTEFFTPTSAYVDYVINHPSVRPSLRGDHVLESYEVVADPANVVLAMVGGVVLFKNTGPSEYEGHIFCIERHRGKSALALVAKGLQAVFDRSGSSLVRALAPLHLPAVGVLCRRAGFKLVDRDLFVEHFVYGE